HQPAEIGQQDVHRANRHAIRRRVVADESRLLTVERVSESIALPADRALVGKRHHENRGRDACRRRNRADLQIPEPPDSRHRDRRARRSQVASALDLDAILGDAPAASAESLLPGHQATISSGVTGSITGSVFPHACHPATRTAVYAQRRCRAFTSSWIITRRNRSSASLRVYGSSLQIIPSGWRG